MQQQYIFKGDEEWYANKYSRPLTIYRYREKKLLSDVTCQLCFRIGIKPTKKVVRGLRRLVLDLYARFKATDGYGCTSIFTSNGALTGKGSTQYSKLGFTGSKLSELVNGLAEQKLLEIQTGVSGWGGGGFSTKVRVTPKLIEHLERSGLRFDQVMALRRYPLIWQYKDENGEKQREWIDKQYAEEAGIQTLHNYNRLLQCSDIKVGDTPLVSYEKQAYRVFRDREAKTYGRIYGGIWQYLPSSARGHITINGYDVIEVDIKSCHPLLAYGVAGFDLTDIRKREGDAYSLPEIDSDNPLVREIIKKGFLMLMNNERKGAAVQALQRYIKSNGELKLVMQELASKNITSSTIINSLEAKHYRITDYLLTESWKQLNYIESSIAMQVIKHFTAMNVLVLTVHDSYVISKAYADELYRLITKLLSKELKIVFRYPDTLIDIKLMEIGYTDRHSERDLRSVRLQRAKFKA